MLVGRNAPLGTQLCTGVHIIIVTFKFLDKLHCLSKLLSVHLAEMGNMSLWDEQNVLDNLIALPYVVWETVFNE